MKRLPGYDSRTRRSESAVFGIIGLAGAALIVAAIIPERKSAGEREPIGASLVVPADSELHWATKLPAPASFTNATTDKAAQPTAVLRGLAIPVVCPKS